MSDPGAVTAVSPRRRREVLDALRRGTVPAAGLDMFAVGLDRLEGGLGDDLDTAASGGAAFKAVRGEYGAGKTFLARWLGERAKSRGMAVAEVQISETETPLHRLETVYRRLCERLSTPTAAPSAFRPVLDAWLFTLEEDVLASGDIDPSDQAAVDTATESLLERRLSTLNRVAPGYAAGLRGYRRAIGADDTATADGLSAWLAGERHVAASVRRAAGIKGDLDHFLALSFLQGLLGVLRDSGHPGLLLVLDEVETLQRVRSDARTKALNALRQLIDEIDSGRFPGLYLVMTGTPAFYDGRQGVQLLSPLAQRLHTDFTTDARFDNPRAAQVRLPSFDTGRLIALGVRVRDLYAVGSSDPERLRSVVDDAYLNTLASAVAGTFGGRVGIAPRLFLRKLVADVLDRVDQFEDFDPSRHYTLTVARHELTEVEQQAVVTNPDEVDLDD
ncbi:MAG: BREX system ATP-binding protein BrxD [Pseudonocardia sp.]|nr:BREX system ATP-binding protein BrxD [Pseudonocardia sp.]